MDIVPRICPVSLFPKTICVVSGPILRRCTPPTRASLKSSFLHQQFLWLHQPPPLRPHLNQNQWHRLPKHLFLLLPLLLPLLLLILWLLQSVNPQDQNRPKPVLWEQLTSRPWFLWAGRRGRPPDQRGRPRWQLDSFTRVSPIFSLRRAAMWDATTAARAGGISPGTGGTLATARWTYGCFFWLTFLALVSCHLFLFSSTLF